MRDPGPERAGHARRLLEPAAWSVLFVAVRLVAMAIEAPHLHRLDELYAGAAAIELLAGRFDLPWPLLAHAPYCGGSILVVLAAYVLFPVLGASVLVLRLPSLALALGTFLAWTTLAGRLAGARAGRLLALLFALAPIEVVRLDLLAWGNHAESRLPTALALLAGSALLGFGAHAAPPGPGRARALALVAGFLGAFALFFSYAALAPAVALGALLVWRGTRSPTLPPGTFAAHVAGLGLGLAPALVLALSRGLEGPSFLLALVGSVRGHALANAWQLLRHGLRNFLHPDAGLPFLLEALPWLAAVAALALAAARVLGEARRSRLAPEALVLAPVVVFVAVFAVSSLPVGPRGSGVLAFRYLAPLAPFLLAGTALGLARAPRGVAWALAGALVLPAVVRLARTLPEATLLPLRLSGASHLAYAGHVLEVLDFDVTRAAAHVDRIPDRERRAAGWDALATVTLAEALFAGDGTTWAPVVVALRRLPADPERRGIAFERAKLLLEGPLGPSLAASDLDHVRAVLRQAGADANRALVPSAFVVLARSGEGREAVAHAAASLPLALRAAGAEGMGRADGLLDRASLPPPDPELRAAYVAGYAEGRTRVALERGCRERVRGGPLVGRAASVGAERALRDFEPEDPARRAEWASRCALPATEP